MDSLSALQFEWLNNVGPLSVCSLIHQGSCTMEFIKKLTTVFKIGSRYYVLFHMIPLLFQIRKCKDTTKAIGVIKRTLKSYLFSIFFMGFLVSGSKAGLCMLSRAPAYRLDGFVMTFNSLLSSFSILFEQASRRNQIGYFILSKAMRSFYVWMKRTHGWSMKDESQYVHVIFMAVLYFIYIEESQILKFRNIFDKIWADQ